MTILQKRDRPIKICVLNQEPRIADRSLARIETELAKICEFDLFKISSIDDEEFLPCDLLIIIAHTLENEELTTWVKGLAKRMEKSGKILTPALIIGEGIDLASKGLMSFAAAENWYFDMVDVEHISSIAIRAANLIRIHDHIHELGRYETSITKLENQVKDLLQKLP
jgi:hypothetical protein